MIDRHQAFRLTSVMKEQVTMPPLIFIAVFWVAPVFVGLMIGQPKKRAGWAWGLLLGWLGVIIVACLSEKKPQVTAQDIHFAAKQREVEQLETDIRLAELKAQKDLLDARP
jgi:hypothetical protein